MRKKWRGDDEAYRPDQGSGHLQRLKTIRSANSPRLPGDRTGVTAKGAFSSDEAAPSPTPFLAPPIQPTTTEKPSVRCVRLGAATGIALTRILGYFKGPMLPVSTGSGTRGCAGGFRKCAPLFLIAGLTACAGAPVVVATPNSCASLLPQEWKEGVAGAPLPDGDTVADWISFADQQTGKLDIANDRTKAAIGIIERCEARDLASIKRATRRKILGIF